MAIDGGGLNEGESITAGGCVFGGVGVFSRTIPEAGADSRTVGVVGCEGPAGLRESRVGGKMCVAGDISPEGSFGDDLSTIFNGVSGTEDAEGEEVR